MRTFIKSFVMSYMIALWFICAFLHIMYEPKERPSWYGTYYSLADAMEDGWYEKN